MRDFSNFLQIFLLSFLVIVSCTTVCAQQLDPETAGRKFFIAFPKIVENIRDPRFARTGSSYLAYIYSDRDSNTLRVTNMETGTDTLYSLQKWGFTAVDFGANPTVITSDAPSAKTWRLEADEPVIVYCLFFGQFGAEAWTPIPAERWGKEYYAASLPGTAVMDFQFPSSDSLQTTVRATPPQCLIIAAEDNTSVTITPSISGPISPAFSTEPFTIHLNSGEVYQVTGFVDIGKFPNQSQTTISGTRIVSDRPISVISGNSRNDGSIRSQQVTGNTSKNPGYEALSPIEQYGKNFVFLPTWDRVRVMGEPNEKIQEKRRLELGVVYGTQQDSLTLIYQKNGDTEIRRLNNRGGGEVEIELPQPVKFQTTQPTQGMKYSMGAGRYGLRFGRDSVSGEFDSSTIIQYVYTTTAASFMIELTPREQWTWVAPFFVPKIPATTHYLNVVADSISAKNILLIRRQFTSSGEVASEISTPVVFNRGVIPGTDLVWTTLQPNPDYHYCLVGADSSVRFCATLSGNSEGTELYSPQPGGNGEYQEFSALSYGLPLAPRRTAINPATTGVEMGSSLLQLSLRGISANPFTGVTEMLLDVPAATDVKVEIRDVLGREIALILQGEVAAGKHQLRWDATDASPGIYFCRAVVGAAVLTLPLKVVGHS